MGWVGEMCRLYLLRKVQYYIGSLIESADNYVCHYIATIYACRLYGTHLTDLAVEQSFVLL